MGIQSQAKKAGRAAQRVTQCGHDGCDPAGIAENAKAQQKVVIAILIDRRQTRENWHRLTAELKKHSRVPALYCRSRNKFQQFSLAR
jgi:hypothetical protein